MLRLPVAVVLLALPLSAWAIDPPLKDAQRLKTPELEQFQGLQNAHVILADYELIQHDFPQLEKRSHAEIDQWLIEHAAFISLPQLSQSEVNTPILTTDASVQAYRPAEYGRAAVFPVEGGLLDAKGVGALAPDSTGHGTGLATLGEVMREYAYEKLVHRLLEHAGAGITTVRSYAVIDAGFDEIFKDGSRDPAGIIVRQAHQRFYGNHPDRKGASSVFDGRSSWRVEKILRRYGITTAGGNRAGYPHIDMINVQGTSDHQGILDFGAFLAEEQFHRPVTRIFADSRVLSKPGAHDFVQPLAEIRVPLEQWGYGVTGVEDPKMDNPWVWSHELAKSLRVGRATRADVEQHIKNLLGPVEERLKAHTATEACIHESLFTAFLYKAQTKVEGRSPSTEEGIIAKPPIAPELKR